MFGNFATEFEHTYPIFVTETLRKKEPFSYCVVKLEPFLCVSSLVFEASACPKDSRVSIFLNVKLLNI